MSDKLTTASPLSKLRLSLGGTLLRDAVAQQADDGLIYLVFLIHQPGGLPVKVKWQFHNTSTLPDMLTAQGDAACFKKGQAIIVIGEGLKFVVDTENRHDDHLRLIHCMAVSHYPAAQSSTVAPAKPAAQKAEEACA